jgi:acyl carrier protein
VSDEDKTPELAAVKEWLTRYIANLLEFEPSEVRSDISLARYGLDSTAAAGLTGDLAAWLGRDIDPVLLVEQKTIDKLSAFVCEHYHELPRIGK